MTILPLINSIPAKPIGTRLSLFRGVVFSTQIDFILGLCSNVATAQQPGKIFRMGILDPSTASGSAVLWEALRQELSKLGWIEGKNIAIEYRFAENKGPERLPELAADLARLKVDLIVVPGAPALAAKNATTAIPIVM